MAAAAAATPSLLHNLFSFFTTPPPKSPPSHLSLSAPPLVSFNDGVMAVVCPSVAHANTLFFQSGYNVQVIVDDNKPEERLLGRFRREVMQAGVIQECKRRRFFENKQEEKKRKAREAAKRNHHRQPQLRTGGGGGQTGRVKKMQVTGIFLKEAFPNSFFFNYGSLVFVAFLIQICLLQLNTPLPNSIC